MWARRRAGTVGPSAAECCAAEVLREGACPHAPRRMCCPAADTEVPCKAGFLGPGSVPAAGCEGVARLLCRGQDARAPRGYRNQELGTTNSRVPSPTRHSSLPLDYPAAATEGGPLLVTRHSSLFSPPPYRFVSTALSSLSVEPPAKHDGRGVEQDVNRAERDLHADEARRRLPNQERQPHESPGQKATSMDERPDVYGQKGAPPRCTAPPGPRPPASGVNAWTRNSS